MKNTLGQALIATALVSALASTSAFAQGLPTTGTVESRLGKLELKNGFPTEETVQNLYDDLDFQRACQAYIWALPYMAMTEWQRQQREVFGAGNLDYVDYLTFTDKLGILTANATTPYAMAFPNLAETGPLVFEIPAGAMAGGIMDFWERPMTDAGQTGPDKGRGGKFLILGPNDPEVKAKGYFVFRSATNNIWCGMRGLDADIEKARTLVGKLRIYPYAKRGNPPATKHLSPGGKKWSAAQPRGLAYFAGLAKTIGQEPPIERDRIILAMLVPLGIEKGKPFNPDERQKKILIDATNVGELMARTNGYAKRFPGAVVWPGKKWEISLFLTETNQEKPNYTQLDERASWFYEAVGVTVGMMGRTIGAGQVYLESQKDSTGAWLDGGKTYSLHVPKDVPVAQFWSFTVYDNESRCLIDTGSYPDRSSRDDIVTNADGSVDLYFGPVAPAGKPSKNWIKTLPGKGWFTYFRLYAPTQPYFDKTWVLPDIELAK
jgi:hypothetical protein